MHGEVHYDALTLADITKYFRGDVQYVPEDDIHFPTLTVAQTVRFAAHMRAPRNRIGGESREEYKERVTEVLLSLFGLQHAKNTLVGDAVVHGVSGALIARQLTAFEKVESMLPPCLKKTTSSNNFSVASHTPLLVAVTGRTQ
ncbi:hypothetical protein BDZ97DRAFT_1924141 [Flammula alnicola]|nr:hypothetical protein BDZ97DRAFT_1924141 [Flammula alnicola]